MSMYRFGLSGRRLLMAALLLAAMSSPALGQAVTSSCGRAISAVQGGSPRTEDIDLIAGACPREAARIHAQAVQAARDAAAERPLRLAALRVLVTGIRPEVSLSSQWLATARLGDPLPRSMHGGGVPTLAATSAQREAVQSTLAQLALSDADAEVRRASLVLRQALVYADPTLAAVEPNSVRLVAGCADRVRLETMSDISVPYVVRVEGTAFDRTIWMKPPRNGEPSRIELALPAGIVTVTVADRAVARLDARPGPCP